MDPLPNRKVFVQHRVLRRHRRRWRHWRRSPVGRTLYGTVHCIPALTGRSIEVQPSSKRTRRPYQHWYTHHRDRCAWMERRAAGACPLEVFPNLVKGLTLV